jgi:hypothetical protein
MLTQAAYVRLTGLLLIVFMVQNAGIDGAQSRIRQLPGAVAGRLQSRVSSLPSLLRRDAEALISSSDVAEKLRLIERLGDSDSNSVGDFFAALLAHEPVASVRLELVNYLTRNPRPNFRPVFERLAKTDPDAAVAVAALEGVRSIEVLAVREILTQRLAQSGSNAAASEVFAEADERWISLVRGAMLPGFLRVPPAAFSAKQQNRIRVAALGDFGTGTEGQKQVAAAMRSRHQQSAFDIGLTVGDNFYPVGMESPTDERWKTWWEELYAPLQIVFYATLGNHDWYDFDSPAAEILYSHRERSWQMPSPYYTFVAGPIHFFAVDTQEMSQKQLGWLDGEIQKSQSRWKVVYGHHPIYSDGYHGDNSRLVNQLFPLLKNRVDVYLAGHEHDMQHLKPEAGVQFLVSGGGGRSLRPPNPSGRALFAEEVHGFTILEADASRLHIEFVGADSKTLHAHTLSK